MNEATYTSIQRYRYRQEDAFRMSFKERFGDSGTIQMKD